MIQRRTNQSYHLRSGLTLYPGQQKAIEKLLTELVLQVSAHFVLLADVSGQVISTRGEHDRIDLVALGSLIVGDLAASHEIARLTHQYQVDQLVFREGQTIHTLICEAGYHLALMVQVSTEIPLGWVRMIIRQAAQDLANIANIPPAEQERTSAELGLQEEKLPDLFNDALDDLWLE